MGVVIVPSSASRTTTATVRFIRRSGSTARPATTVVAFKTERTSKCSVVKSQDPTTIPVVPKKARPSKTCKNRNKSANLDADLDYNEVAAVLENIYKLSPGADVAEVGKKVVRIRNRKGKRRLRLEERVAMKGRDVEKDDDEEEEERLVKEYSGWSDLGTLDWRRVKIPPVLRAAEQAKLFKLMQPMKAIFDVKENLHKDLSKEQTECELAAAVKMTVPQLRRHIEIGVAARNKLIKHNLRLVLFVIKKYYQEIASGDKFQEFCQAGVKGLITAIDRFEPRRGFRLSTYALFWIRHSIVRSMTVSSFTRVPFGIESVRQEIQKAKLKLMCELQRMPTEEEIIAKAGISPERYHDVMKASKSVFSLNAKHIVTQEEFIYGITDVDGVGGENRRQPALLRLALDDVLDSLKPKESVVIRQRYGLDGKGDRTLGEIAGNLNISREMVRKHELKALMKLKHPTRLDYLRRYI